ncbi:MAG TPA: rod-binding protein [Planctomycetota bacterium]|nr:rod-binding protein [Planctomycetota bacterium]
MDALAIETMTLHPVSPAQKERQRAEKVADQFESVFVRTLVSSLRQTATLGSSGMFGDGPGADTYGDWFDQNLAEQIGKTSHIGIKQSLMTDFERAGAIEKQTVRIDEATDKARTAAAAMRSVTTATPLHGEGGFDVVL